MKTSRTIMAAFSLIALLFVGCGDDGDVNEAADRTADTAEDVAQDARRAAEDAFAELRTQAERAVDEFETRNAPEVKQNLLDRCRDVLEDLRRADSERAGEVDRLCNRIRDTDVSDRDAWRNVVEQIQNLRIN